MGYYSWYCQIAKYFYRLNKKFDDAIWKVCF